MGGFGCLVCWFGHVVAWLIGRLVGTPLMDAWMDGCCVDGEGPAMQTKPPPHGISSIYSTWGKHGVMWFGCLVCWLLGWSVGLAALLLGWLVGWLALI